VARIAAALTVSNSSKWTFTNAAHVADPGSITQDVFVSVNLATAGSVDCLEQAFAQIIRTFRSSGYLPQHL
jgi:hypothetical protein